jgi:hypothetical protein
VDALQPAVVDYWIDDTGFALASDLARLDRVRAAGAAESAVLYCNRIVEAMARRTVGPTARTGPPSLAALPVRNTLRNKPHPSRRESIARTRRMCCDF